MTALLRYLLSAAALVLFATAARAQVVIVDNADPGFAVELGAWQTGSATAGGFGPDYRFANVIGGAPTARCRFTPDLPLTGYYYIGVWYNTGTNRTTIAPYTVHGDLATSTVLVNQQLNGSQFFYIGQMHFTAGTSGSVSIANNADNLVVMADAVAFSYAGVNPGPEPGGEEPEPPGPEPPEYRGLWVSRFEWPTGGPTSTRSRIDTIIGRMAAGNFNSLFMQVRGVMETYYPSPNEPWAAFFGYTNPGYDPMAYAITKAHAAGIEFHAYINTHAISQGVNPPSAGTTPIHPFYTHGNPNDPAHDDWVIHLSDGNPQPLGTGEDSYNWTSPGVPSFQKWTRDQVLHVAANYDVDGVHFDRIRFSGQGSYDPVSLARSASGAPSNPANLTFRNWNRDQITRLLNDIYGAVAEINYNNRNTGKRHITVSSAPFRGKSQQESVNQMLGEWTGIGAQDFFVPQVYDSGLTNFSNNLNSNFPISNGRFVVTGMSRNSTGNFENTRAQIERSRELGARGTVIFSYSAFASPEFDQFANTIYQKDVPTPAMEWITTPTQAIIVGIIADLSSNPLEDAQVKVNGNTYTWLSGSDGFYSMLKLPANAPLTLTITKAGQPTKTVPVPSLSAGEVRRINVVMGNSGVGNWSLY